MIERMSHECFKNTSDPSSKHVPLWHDVECSRVTRPSSSPRMVLELEYLRGPDHLRPAHTCGCPRDLKSTIFAIKFLNFFLAALGPLLAAFGPFLGRSWQLLGAFWPPREPPQSLQNECQGALLLRCDFQTAFR